MKLNILKIICIFLVGMMAFKSYLALKAKTTAKMEKNSSDSIASVFSLNKYLKNKFESEHKLTVSNKSAVVLHTNNKIQTNTNKSNLKYLKKTNKIQSQNTLMNKAKQNSFIQGWLKYLEMNENSNDVPSTFKKNNVFHLQMSENQTMNTIAKDNIGFINIPNDMYHYFELTESQLKVFSARPGKYRNFKESLQLSDIIPLISVNPCKGGIEDVGSFAEGFCFLIKFIKFSKHFIWELCSDTIFEKNNWVNHFVKAISKVSPIPATTNAFISSPVVAIAPSPVLGPIIPSFVQPVNTVIGPQSIVAPGAGVGVSPLLIGSVAPIPSGFVVQQDWSACNKPCDTGIQTRILDCMDINICMGEKFEERLCNTQRCKEDIDNSFEKLKKVSEGQWEYLGSWTKCSKACGGGIRTINRKCISGTCVGDTIITEDCNTMICQTMTGSDPNKMEISVFEREVYDECKLLEGNLVMVLNNNRMLTHVEVNTQEIQLIKQDDPLHPIIFPISKLMDVKPSMQAPGCIDMIDMNSKPIVLCPDAVKAISCDLWIQRIREFKTNCTKRLLTKMESEISNSLSNMKDPNASMRTLDNVQQKLLDEQKLKASIKKRAMEDQFEEFKRQANNIIYKEDLYEQKLQQQEEERIKFDKQRMEEEKQRQISTAEKLLADMKSMADADAEYKIKEQTIKREMKDIMKQVEDKLNEKRTNFVKKMQQMKTIHELTQKKTAMELMDAKRSIGKQLTSLAARGDPNQCLIKNPVIQNDYCTRKFQNNFDMQIECKKPKQYCYICCDAEIPTLEKSNVACCYKKCDDLEYGDCRTFNEVYNIHSNTIAYIK